MVRGIITSANGGGGSSTIFNVRDLKDSPSQGMDGPVQDVAQVGAMLDGLGLAS